MVYRRRVRRRYPLQRRRRPLGFKRARPVRMLPLRRRVYRRGRGRVGGSRYSQVRRVRRVVRMRRLRSRLQKRPVFKRLSCDIFKVEHITQDGVYSQKFDLFGDVSDFKTIASNYMQFRVHYFFVATRVLRHQYVNEEAKKGYIQYNPTYRVHNQFKNANGDFTELSWSNIRLFGLCRVRD